MKMLRCCGNDGGDHDGGDDVDDNDGGGDDGGDDVDDNDGGSDVGDGSEMIKIQKCK